MNYTEDQDDALLLGHVVHHPIVADAKPMEGVAGSVDGLGSLASGSPWLRDVGCELLKRLTNAPTDGVGELSEVAGRGSAELDGEGLQSRSSSRVVRPALRSARA